MGDVKTFPSGFRAEIRGLKTREANVLAAGGAAKKGSAVDEVLRACVESVEDPGPYEIAKDGKPTWDKVLVADRMALLIRVRIETYGADYTFRMQCKSASCRQGFDHEMDLEQDVVVKPVPPESIECFAANNRFTHTLGSTGRDVVFQLMTTGLEKASERLVKQNRGRVITAALATRIVSIDGVDSNDKLRFLDDLPMRDTDELLVALDAVDGGVETTLETDCPHCGTTQEFELPFGQEFWLPQKTKSRTTASRST